MTIQEYIRIIRRRGWIVVVAVLLCAIAAYSVSSFQKELYRASVHVSTVPARADWGLASTASELMRNFVANIQTPEMAQRVIDEARLDMNPYDFLANVKIAPDSSTFLIRIDAESGDPEVAKRMAITLAELFEAERNAYYAQQDKRDRIEVKIVSRAIDAPLVQPRPRVNALAGAVLGLLLGVGVVLALTWMEADMLRTPAAVERTLDLPVLGAIPSGGKTTSPPQPAAQPGAMGAPETA
jgi:capsular polysaccharide biosynthesis protein